MNNLHSQSENLSLYLVRYFRPPARGAVACERLGGLVSDE